MRRVTVTLPDDLEQALIEYQQAQDVPPSLTAIVQQAIRQYLAQRGPFGGRAFIPAQGPLWFTPDEHGSGRSDISVNHDRVAAEVASD